MPASRITNKKSYNVTSNETRKQFIERVFSIRKKSIKDIAKELGIKYSTGKEIIRIFRSEGRLQKKSKKIQKTHNFSKENSKIENTLNLTKMEEKFAGEAEKLSFPPFQEYILNQNILYNKCLQMQFARQVLMANQFLMCFSNN